MINTFITREQIVVETDKAIQVNVTSGVTNFGSQRLVWLPKSQIQWLEYDSSMAPTLHMPAWLARKNFS